MVTSATSHGCARTVSSGAVLFVVVFSAFLALARFSWEGRVGFSLWDEGYLWYGVQRVLHGEVPIRDFAAYDPGRYYWAGLLLHLFHDPGIVALRAATFAFTALGLAAAGWLVLKGATGSVLSRLMLAGAAMALSALWMVPWWKSYDATISLVLAASLAFLLERPVPMRFFGHGVVVGISAVFGRNHGTYGVVACLLAAVALACCGTKPDWRRSIAAWIAGVLVGFSPILAMMALDRAFADMFLDGVRYILFEFKRTNIALPVPWPWTVHFGGADWTASLWSWLVGCCFVLLPLFCVVAVAMLGSGIRRARVIAHPAFAACAFTAIPYMNVAFSRAEAGHLAQAIPPVVVGILILPLSGAWRSANRLAAIPLFAAVSLFVALPMHPGHAVRAGNWKEVDVRGDSIWMDPSTASLVGDIERLALPHVARGETFLAAPVLPSAYALLGVRSPVWEIYPLTPRSESFEKAEIARFEAANVGIVFIEDIALDGSEDLRYRSTHPVLWRYITSHYRRLPYEASDPQLKVYAPADPSIAP